MANARDWREGANLIGLTNFISTMIGPNLTTCHVKLRARMFGIFRNKNIFRNISEWRWWILSSVIKMWNMKYSAWHERGTKKKNSGIYSNSGYSAPGSRKAGMEIQVFRNENSSQTNAFSHYSSYSYSGLIPNERVPSSQLKNCGSDFGWTSGARTKMFWHLTHTI